MLVLELVLELERTDAGKRSLFFSVTGHVKGGPTVDQCCVGLVAGGGVALHNQVSGAAVQCSSVRLKLQSRSDLYLIGIPYFEMSTPEELIPRFKLGRLLNQGKLTLTTKLRMCIALSR